jgi:7-cyano-7-deazaguanine synthase
MKAVVLLSGGIDSTTTLAIAKNEGRECYALSFRYGQRHSIELDAANWVAQTLGVREHLVLGLPLDRWGGSALTDNIEVPKNRDVRTLAGGVPVTYVPARNTVFLSLALAWSEAIGAGEIWIGVNALDYSGYPDCRPEYIEAFQEVARLGTRVGIENGGFLKIRSPLIHLTKAEIIGKGVEMGIDFGMTRSCYDPPSWDLACGCCDSCLLRRKGFSEAGVPDPLKYAR